MNHKLKLTTAIFTALLANGAMAGDEMKADFSKWDSNSDEMVSMQEWNAGLSQHETYMHLGSSAVTSTARAIDEDQMEDAQEAAKEFLDDNDIELVNEDIDVDQQTFASTTFRHFDENNDSMLDEDEFEEFSDKAEDAELLSSL